MDGNSEDANRRSCVAESYEASHHFFIGTHDRPIFVGESKEDQIIPPTTFIYNETPSDSSGGGGAVTHTEVEQTTDICTFQCISNEQQRRTKMLKNYQSFVGTLRDYCKPMGLEYGDDASQIRQTIIGDLLLAMGVSGDGRQKLNASILFPAVIYCFDVWLTEVGFHNDNAEGFVHVDDNKYQKGEDIYGSLSLLCRVSKSLNDTPENLIDNSTRILKPGGIILGSTKS